MLWRTGCSSTQTPAWPPQSEPGSPSAAIFDRPCVHKHDPFLNEVSERIGVALIDSGTFMSFFPEDWPRLSRIEDSTNIDPDRKELLPVRKLASYRP